MRILTNLKLNDSNTVSLLCKWLSFMKVKANGLMGYPHALSIKINTKGLTISTLKRRSIASTRSKERDTANFAVLPLSAQTWFQERSQQWACEGYTTSKKGHVTELDIRKEHTEAEEIITCVPPERSVRVVVVARQSST